MKKCGLYVRVSTELQAHKKDGSLDTQLDILKKYVEIKNSSTGEDWRTVATYREEGKSGKNTDRPEYQHMIQDIKNGKVNAILCTKIDRISRSLMDFYHFHELLEEYEVTFISLNENWDTSTPIGRFALKITLAAAELEREQTASRTREKMQWRAEQGLSSGGQILGYDIDPDNPGILKVNEEEKKLVMLIFETYVKEKSFMRVANIINAKGYRTKSYTSRRGQVHGGTKFIDTHVSRVLQNPYYIGKVVHKGNCYDGKHKPIVPEELFEKVQRIIQSNQVKQSRGRKHTKHLFILQGLVRCGECNAFMTPYFVYNHERKPYFYYTCTKTQHLGNKEFRMSSVPAAALEDVIVKRLVQLKEDPNLVSEMVQNATAQSSGFLQELTEAKDRLSEHRGSIEQRINTLVESLADGKVQIKSVSQKIVELEERKEQLGEEIQKLEMEMIEAKRKVVNANTLKGRLTTFSELFTEATPEEKKELIMLQINLIVWTPQEIRLALFGNSTMFPKLPTLGEKVSRDSCIWHPGSMSQSVLLWDKSRLEIKRVAKGHTRITLLPEVIPVQIPA